MSEFLFEKKSKIKSKIKIFQAKSPLLHLTRDKQKLFKYFVSLNN